MKLILILFLSLEIMSLISKDSLFPMVSSVPIQNSVPTSNTIDSTYLGCFNLGCYNFENPKLVNYQDYSSNTVEKCLTFCAVKNSMRYSLLTQYSCYCTNESAFSLNGGQIADTNCNNNCPGNSSEICGGRDSWCGSFSIFDSSPTGFYYFE